MAFTMRESLNLRQRLFGLYKEIALGQYEFSLP